MSDSYLEIKFFIYYSNLAVFSFNSLSSSFIWSELLFFRLSNLEFSSSITCFSLSIYLSFSMLFLSFASFIPASSMLNDSIFFCASAFLYFNILIYVFFSANCLSYCCLIESNSPFFKLDSLESKLSRSSSYFKVFSKIYLSFSRSRLVYLRSPHSLLRELTSSLMFWTIISLSLRLC